jgi:steroid delta-isomerase-like uncharacterized protein
MQIFLARIIQLFCLLLITATGTPAETVSIEHLQKFSDAWNSHDINALMMFMADDCVFHAVAGADVLGKSFFGLDDVRTGFLTAFQNFPDAAWIDPVHFVSSDGSRAVTESTFVGTKKNVDGTYVRIEARMVDVFTFNKDGKIVTKNAFRKDRPAIAIDSNEIEGEL